MSSVLKASPHQATDVRPILFTTRWCPRSAELFYLWRIYPQLDELTYMLQPWIGSCTDGPLNACRAYKHIKISMYRCIKYTYYVPLFYLVVHDWGSLGSLEAYARGDFPDLIWQQLSSMPEKLSFSQHASIQQSKSNPSVIPQSHYKVSW